MKLLTYIWLLVMTGMTFHAWGQDGRTVKGVLTDSEQRPVSGASVYLYSDRDTLKTSSSAQGEYVFNKVKSSKFEIVVQALGHSQNVQSYDYATNLSNITLPTFVLNYGLSVLEEVVVSGVKVVQVKGDTIEYGIDNLKLRDGAATEDALKRLQGVEVDRAGNVTAQGESVTRVRVNGKDFFGGDVKTVTQNLPANIISKIQVIDDYGDMANITGNRSGDSEKVLNIVIDPKYNDGWTTILRAGGGTEGRYQLTGMWMGMTDRTQVSVLANTNNMNAQLFDFQTMGGGARMRGGRGRGAGSSGMFGNNQEGITQTGSIGANIRHDFNDKLKAYFSYSYGHNDNNTIANIFTEYIGQNLIQNGDEKDNNIRTNHRFESNVEWRFSDKDYLKISPQFGLNRSLTNNVLNSTFLRDNLLDNFQNLTNRTDSDAPRYSVSGLYNHKFNDAGRNLFVDFSYDNSTSVNDYNQRLERNVYDPINQNVPINTIIENTIRDVENKSWTSGSSLSYIEPFTKFAKVEFTYDLNKSQYDNFDRQSAHDDDNNPINPVGQILNYAYEYDYAFTSHRIGASFIYEKDKIKYSLGAAVQPTLLKGEARAIDNFAVINQKNLNWMPIARFEYKFSNQSNISIRYSGQATEPSVSQILPFGVSTNRTLTTFGNENLNPEFKHRLRVSTRIRDLKKGNSLFLILRSDLTNNSIVTMNKRYAEEGNGIFQQTNFKNETAPVFNLSGFYHIGKSLKEETYNFTYSGGLVFATNYSYLATQQSVSLDEYKKNRTDNSILSQNLFFRYTPSEKLEISPGIRYTYNRTTSSLPEFQAPNITSIAPTLVGSVNLASNTILGADLSKAFNRGYANNVNPFVINAYIEQRFLKQRRGALRLEGFDLLNQQVNLNRSVGEILTDRQSNRLARYFLLSFTFRLQKFALGTPSSDSDGRGNRRI